MITVCLYGGLRECGRRFDLQVASPAEAVHALMVQIPALRKKLMKGFYQVRFGRRDWSEVELKSSFGETAEGILHIVPRVQGAGKNGGIIQTIVGVVIAVVGAYFAQPWAVQLGIGLAVGAVVMYSSILFSAAENWQWIELRNVRVLVPESDTRRF